LTSAGQCPQGISTTSLVNLKLYFVSPCI
jgi:hypothetical protein